MKNGLTLLPPHINIPFVRFRWVTYTLSLLMVLTTAVAFFTRGLNYGIDFKGGIMIEMKTQQPADIAALRSDLSSLGLGDVTLQEYGSPYDVLIRIENQPGGEKGQIAAVQHIKQHLGGGYDFRRVETVGPKIGAELISNGLQAIMWCLCAILIYIWFRFEWQFGLCAVVALIHNTIAVLGLYAIFGVEFNTTAIVGILTTIGYSINDTVVIYDRIRENLKRFRKKAVGALINDSINETLSRTILTSGSTLTALLSLYIWGGEVIAAYALPIIVGVVVGTYSSICLAGPLLRPFDLRPKDDDSPNTVVPSGVLTKTEA